MVFNKCETAYISHKQHTTNVYYHPQLKDGVTTVYSIPISVYVRSEYSSAMPSLQDAIFFIHCKSNQLHYVCSFK